MRMGLEREKVYLRDIHASWRFDEGGRTRNNRKWMITCDKG